MDAFSQGSSLTAMSAMCIVGPKRWTGKPPSRSRLIYVAACSTLMTCYSPSNSLSKVSCVTTVTMRTSCYACYFECVTSVKRRALVPHLFAANIQFRPSYDSRLHTGTFCVILLSLLPHAFSPRSRIPPNRTASFNTTRTMTPPWPTTSCMSNFAKRTISHTAGLGMATSMRPCSSVTVSVESSAMASNSVGASSSFLHTR